MLPARRLPLILASLVLLGLAFGVSCSGFFVDPTLTSIAISPLTPQVEVGKTLQLSVFGTYDDGSRKQVKSGINWSTSPTGIASIDPKTSIMTGIQTGTTTISADVDALPATATATVFVVITQLSIKPTSASAPQGGSANFTVSDQNNNNVSNLANVVAQLNGTTVNTITCDFDNVQNLQVCQIDSTAVVAPNYQIIATYPGFSGSATATLAVTQAP